MHKSVQFNYVRIKHMSDKIAKSGIDDQKANSYKSLPQYASPVEPAALPKEDGKLGIQNQSDGTAIFQQDWISVAPGLTPEELSSKGLGRFSTAYEANQSSVSLADTTVIALDDEGRVLSSSPINEFLTSQPSNGSVTGALITPHILMPSDTNALRNEAPGKFEHAIGNPGIKDNLFQPLESPGDTLDTVISLLNLSGMKIDTPTGATRQWMELLVGGSAFASALYAINTQYTKLVLLPGKVPMKSGLPWLGLYLAISGTTRFLTDQRQVYARTGEVEVSRTSINLDVLYASFLVWAVSSPAWPWVTAIQYPLSGPLQKVLNSNNTQFAPYIYNGAELTNASAIAVRELMAAHPERAFSFKADAEHLARQEVARAVNELEGNVRITVNTTAGNSRSLREAIDVVRNSNASFSAEATYVRSVSNDLVSDGKILAGSWIQDGGRQVKITSGMDVVAPNVIKVIKGQIQVTEIITDSLSSTRQLARLSSSNAAVSLKIEGPAAILPKVAAKIAGRPMGALRVPFTEVAVQEGFVPLSIKQKIRSMFSPTQISVEYELASGIAGAQVTENLAIENKLAFIAGQKRFGVRLPSAPRAPLSALTADYLVANQGTKFSVRIPIAVVEEMLTKDDATVLRALRDDGMLKSRIDGADFSAASTELDSVQLNNLRKDGKTHVLLDVDAVKLAEVTRNPTHPLVMMAKETRIGSKIRSFFGLRSKGATGSAELQLANLTRLPKDSWRLTGVEAEGLAVRAGSTVGKSELLASRSASLAVSAGSLARTGLALEGSLGKTASFINALSRGVMHGLATGRWRPFVAVTGTGGMAAAPVIGAMVFAEGWRDWNVIIPSALRANYTGMPNNLFAPAMVAIQGESTFHNYKYYPWSVAFLRVLEIFFQAPEADVKLYKQSARLLRGEDRPNVREEYIDKLINIESYANFNQRPALLAVRIANGIHTGYARRANPDADYKGIGSGLDGVTGYPGDAKVLMAMYISGKERGLDSFEKDFFTALNQDKALLFAIQEDSVAKEFFTTESRNLNFEWVL